MLGDLDAVDFRHADIEQHDVGPQFRQQFERAPAVFRLAGDLQRHFQRAVAKQIAQAVARRRFIIDDHDAQGLRCVHARPVT